MGCFPPKKVVIETPKVASSRVPASATIAQRDFKKNDDKTQVNAISVLSEHNAYVNSIKFPSGENIKIKNLITKVETKVEDNYRILNKLGKGSFGSVFKVLHITTGIIRAMKVIKKESLAYQDDDQTFLKEIEILIATDHPNIIKIYEYYSDDINYYLITEFVSGGELYETISSWKTFDEEKAAYIFTQIVSAINYLHSKKIVHRDIKPENMLVENKVKGENNNEMINIKLIDFGTCNYLADGKTLSLKVGSPYYIAPEVLKRNYNEKCDIWSCGVILYIMLVGFPPFSGTNTKELLENVEKGIYSLSTPEWSKVSKEAKDVVAKMLEVDYPKRLSAQAVLEHPWMIKAKQANKLNNVDDDYFTGVLANIQTFNAKEKLQQATIAYIVHFVYNSKELEELKKVFKIMDNNGDGRLTYHEVKIAFEKFSGKSISDSQIMKIIEEMDGDSDGYISYEEFLRVSISQKKLLEEKNLKMAFDRFDANKDGSLNKEEIKKVLGVTDNEYINKLLSHIDENNDGEIGYSEFINLMNGILNPASPAKNSEQKLKQFNIKNNAEVTDKKNTDVFFPVENGKVDKSHDKSHDRSRDRSHDRSHDKYHDKSPKTPKNHEKFDRKKAKEKTVKHTEIIRSNIAKIENNASRDPKRNHSTKNGARLGNKFDARKEHKLIFDKHQSSSDDSH